MFPDDYIPFGDARRNDESKMMTKEHDIIAREVAERINGKQIPGDDLKNPDVYLDNEKIGRIWIEIKSHKPQYSNVSYPIREFKRHCDLDSREPVYVYNANTQRFRRISDLKVSEPRYYASPGWGNQSYYLISDNQFTINNLIEYLSQG